MTASSKVSRVGRSARPHKVRYGAKKCFIDRELMIFREKINVMKNALADKDTAQDKKCEIENEIAEIVEDCQKHLGKDLNYSFGHDVCATFKKFYLPRLNIIKSMLPEYFIS